MDVQAFWSAFLPLFVAVDIVGVLPVYLGFMVTVEERDRRGIVVDATLTAAGVGGAFLFLGDAILHAVGVSVGDFQVAGGLLLLGWRSTISCIPNSLYASRGCIWGWCPWAPRLLSGRPC